MQTKETDLQILKQFQGFLNTELMIDQLPNSNVSAFEFHLLSETKNKTSFPFDEARVFRFLGKRAEVFFRHFINLSSRYEEIIYSLQIFDDQTTVGEFDFICKDLVHDEILHVELVNKIYLYDDGLHENPDYCWIGPNRRDRFIDKLDKLATQQFPLLYHPTAESLLNQLQINPWNVQQKLCFKAILFLPEHCRTRFFTTNLEAIVGFYYTLEQFLNKNWKHDLFFIPQKINWFVNESQHTHWNTYAETLLQLQKFMENHQSVMLYRKNKKGVTSKCFVVWW